MQIPSGSSGHASSTAFSSSNREPSELPCPAVFSSRIRSSPELQPARRLLQRFRDRRHARLDRALEPASRMHHQKIRAKRHPSHELLVKSLHRLRAQHRIRRCQIDQVVRMDHQRAKPRVPCAAREIAPPRSRRCASFRAPTSAGSMKRSAVRSRPARAPFRAHRSRPLQSTCGCRCAGCRLSRLEFRVREAVRDDTRRPRRRPGRFGVVSLPFPHGSHSKSCNIKFYRKPCVRANSASPQ